jgi:hypothetical protein
MLIFRPAKNNQPDLKVWRCSTDKGLVITVKNDHARALHNGRTVAEGRTFKGVVSALEKLFGEEVEPLHF